MCSSQPWQIFSPFERTAGMERFSLLYCLPFLLCPLLVREALRPRLTRSSDHVPVSERNMAGANHRCIRLRTQVLPWNKASRTLISHHPDQTCCDCSFYWNTTFAILFSSIGVEVKSISPVIAQHPRQLIVCAE